MPKRNDHLLVEDIYEAALKIERYTQGYSFEDFKNDERTIDAVLRNFEIIGEASRNLSADFCKRNSHIPWPNIIAYRNLLIHEYFGISLKTVWNIVEVNLPVLLREIDPLRTRP